MKNRSHTHSKTSSKIKGFTLIELLSTAAIIGVLVSVAMPVYMDFSVQAKATEGVMLLGEMRSRVSLGYNETGQLGSEIPVSPPPNGTGSAGGNYYTYESMFSSDAHYIWEGVEYIVRGPYRLILLTAHRREEWGNTDISLYLQVKIKPEDDSLHFRCTVNNVIANIAYVPNNCRTGDVNDWNW